MTSQRDPAAMSPAERLAELAAILAVGYLRLLAKGHISTGEPSLPTESAAPCYQTVNSRENRQEVTWKKA